MGTANTLDCTEVHNVIGSSSTHMTKGSQQLPQDVCLLPLQPHVDARGIFTEVFRAEWETHVEPLQWNAVASHQNVLRGVHAHWRHGDYLVVLQGRMFVGLQDLRRACSTYGVAASLLLTADEPMALVIPPGVAHGFFFPAPATHLYAVSHYWNSNDELGCRWDDPGLKIPWPCNEPILSPRDASLGDLAVLVRQVNQKIVALQS